VSLRRGFFDFRGRRIVGRLHRNDGRGCGPLAATLARAFTLRPVVICAAGLFVLSALASLKVWRAPKLFILQVIQSFGEGTISVLPRIALYDSSVRVSSPFETMTNRPRCNSPAKKEFTLFDIGMC
jgi:hypothetical protein